MESGGGGGEPGVSIGWRVGEQGTLRPVPAGVCEVVSKQAPDGQVLTSVGQALY